MAKINKRDKLASGPTTTDSLGTSTSSNITVDSSGFNEDKHGSLIDTDTKKSHK